METLLYFTARFDPITSQNGDTRPSLNNRRKKKHKKKVASTEFPIIPEDPFAKKQGSSGSSFVEVPSFENYGIRDNGNVNKISYVGGGSVLVMEESVCQNVCGFGELRQRNVNGVGEEMETAAARVDEGRVEVSSWKELLPPTLAKPVANGNVANKVETAESLDWKRLMAEDPNWELSMISAFSDLFHRNLIDVGFFVCFDSFLSLLTIMPTRILILLWRLLTTRQAVQKASAAEVCDFGCFAVLACGVILLEQTDISLIYHMIRGQGTIKLYLVYSVLEIFDKLCQSFGGDAITLSTSIVAHNNALFALLVSNNFAEIKSNVFKRFGKDNIQSLVDSDSVERFHISAFLLFVLAQNILEAEGPWFKSFLLNALLVFICEMLIDILKHSFLAKFNGIKPIAYSEFFEDLCKQTLNIQTEDSKKNLTFVPLAPACVVIRVLTPAYAAYLPYNPLPWRFFWIIFLISMTYIMLSSLKVMIGMGLQKLATWYVNRCCRRKQHLHFD
ncbi:hypothetical protein DITRI_Ditri12bG0025800 [Diplodiscus trichospermus]